MDVDPPSSSTSRLSVLCSTSAEYSSSCSNSSEGSSPNSRRSSMNENVIKDIGYWERRRKNNDASRRSREKRRLGDLAMEQKLLQLSQENERLKTQLETRATVVTAAAPPPPEIKAPPPPLPTSALASALGLPPASIPALPLSAAALPSIPQSSAAVLPPLAAQQLPMLQLAQLAAIQQQYAAAQLRPSCVFSTGSAFVPFHKETQGSVIMRATERTSPDSSSDRHEIRTTAVIRRVPSPRQLDRSHPPPPPPVQHSVLGALLSTRRPSPTVPQSRTEHLGLGSPPRGSKSDCESISSSASFSPSHSSEDQMELNDPALRLALGDDKNGGGNQYIDRRRRNNEAAKRCRANRRAVFEYRSRRVQMLENENEQLKEEIGRLKKELEQQRTLLAMISREGI